MRAMFAPVRARSLKQVVCTVFVPASERKRTRANAEPCHSCHASSRNPGEGGASGCDVLVRPRPRPDTFVQRVGGEVGTARPDDGPRLGVDPHPAESLGCKSLLEHRPPHALKHRYLAGKAVRKRQSEHPVAHNRDCRDIWSHTDHRNGSISRSVSPTRASRQFSSSSSWCSSAHASTSRSCRRPRLLSITSTVSIRTFA